MDCGVARLDKISLSDLLGSYQKRVESAIKFDLEQRDRSTRLHEACSYALLNGGKRFRPALVMMIAECLGTQEDVSRAAIAIEYFHTASLVVDDMPCMDDDSERRGKPTTHKAFNEATALLVSFSLIAAGYECICNNAHDLPYGDAIRHIALTNVTFNTGIDGITGGQYLDLFPENLTLEVLLETIRRKTVTLFEVAFVLGWLFGGGSVERLREIKEAAHHFGMAFQIADDFGDAQEDADQERAVNLVTFLGFDGAKKKFHVELSEYRKRIAHLGLENSKLSALADILENSI